MRTSLLALSTLAFLAGCPEDDVSIEPVPAPRPIRLEAGAYGVVVTDVDELDCEGMRTEDLFGMMLPLEVQFGRGGAASGYLADLYVEGSRADGVLRLQAIEAPVVMESEAGEDDEADVPPDEGTESDDDAEGEDEAGGGSSSGSAGGDCDDDDDVSTSTGEDRGGCDDDDDVEDPVVVYPDFELGLELVAERVDHASGKLSYRYGACRLLLDVEAQRLEREDVKPVPVEEEEQEEPEEVPGEECDDEDVDCG